MCLKLRCLIIIYLNITYIFLSIKLIVFCFCFTKFLKHDSADIEKIVTYLSDKYVYEKNRFVFLKTFN